MPSKRILYLFQKVRHVFYSDHLLIREELLLTLSENQAVAFIRHRPVLGKSKRILFTGFQLGKEVCRL